MILREWRGRTDYGREENYPQHFRQRVVPELRQVPGFMGAELLGRDIGGGIEFTVITRWTSKKAVSAFAGSDPTKAIVEQGAVDALRDFDERVSHHDVIETITGTKIAD